MQKTALLGQTLAELTQLVKDLGMPAFTGKQIAEWIYSKRVCSIDEMTNISVKNRALLNESFEVGRYSPIHEQVSIDGTVKYLFKTAKGHLIESVYIPEDDRSTLCISSQVGCKMNCLFCMTGKQGFSAHLTTHEILNQFYSIPLSEKLTNIVFMGMGEPAHNLDNVLEAIDILGTDAFIGHKNLVLSTVGDMRVFDRLPTLKVRPALALSLHTTKADLREYLLPKAPKISPQELMELAESYARLVKHPTQVQWTLLKGVNDGQDELDAILKLFKGKYAVLNLIPFNSLEGDDYQRPDGERIVEIVRYLHSRGVLTKVRNSAGQDIDGGCGQLRARAVELVNTSRL